ncbi:MAG TPA: hypothetical protein VGP47_05060 [Parachlamydiaceae bacterium]|nr:hypothetical protein [Parachlamydiaceae bacterium]
MKLYEDTENALLFLNSFYKNHKSNNKIIALVSNKLLDRFDKQKTWECDYLAQWIAHHSISANGKITGNLEFIGAYRPLHHLFTILTQMQKTSRSDLEFMDVIFESEETLLKGLAYIDEFSLKYITDMSNTRYIKGAKREEQLIGDISKMIFSYLGINDLNAMQASSTLNQKIVDEMLQEDIKELSFTDLLNLKKCSQHNEPLVLQEFIVRLNTKMINLAGLNIKTVKEITDFFGNECKKIERITLNEINPADLDELAVHCVNLKHLILYGVNETKEVELTRKFDSLESLELWVINDSDIFNQIIKSCPSITKLNCHSLQIDNFMVLKKCRFLNEIIFQGEINTLDGLNRCTSLEKVNLDDCSGPLNIRILGECKNLKHLSIYNTEVQDMDFNLPSLISLYVYSHNFNDFSFLQGSPNFKELIVDELTNIDALQYCPSITSLQLIDFPNSVMPNIKKCPLITNLLLKGNISYVEDYETTDINELNASKNLESLSIMDCHVADFGVLYNHPSLKELHIKNCENAHTAQRLERKIKVIYE